MKVLDKYKVNWQYLNCIPEMGRKLVKIDRYDKEVRDIKPCTTICNISEITGDKENPYKEIISVSIKKHHLDEFCKKTARKISFKRAISQFDKPTRKFFWDAYVQNIKL